MSAARLQQTLDTRKLFLGLLAIGILVLVPIRPASALDSTMVRDVEVPYGTSTDEAYTVVGDVRVDGTVYGDVRCAFGDIVVEGPVTGDVQSGFGDVYVDAPVGGSVDVGRGNVRLGPNAHVAGDLSLGNGRRPMTHPASVVEGDQRYGMMSSGSPLVDGGMALANLTMWLLTTLGFCAIAMLFAVLARRPLRASARSLEDSPGRSMLMGAASLPTAVLFSVLLAVTVVGAPLLLLSVPAYLALVLFGVLVSAYYVGRRLLLATGRHRGGEAFASAVGAFAISVVYLVPFVGGVVLFLLALLGAGATIVAVLERFTADGRSRKDHPFSYEPYPGERHR